ncbi:MAG: cardiolipin synthase B [Steroidobacteraceae bacterium]|nr:cardiolipin synthase B [Steroidobacteraceae bacterium]
MSIEPSGLTLPSARDTRDSALLDRAFTRAAGSPLVPGNSLRVLKDGADNYSAWLEAIRHARERIYFENYFIVDDATGREFAEALAERARAGVRVRLIYDWVGSLHKAPRRFWRALTDAGVEVRCFNPFRFSAPFQTLHRDHRKMIAIDGRVGFITGLCVGDMWIAHPGQGGEGWRDTGVEIRGPALCDIERAFAQVWAAIGTPIPPNELVRRESIPEAGDVSLRIVASAPGATGLFRVDQLVAAAARHSLWLTDAYFAGVPPYVQALRAAAKDGVDVRLLVPGASDIPALRPITQAGYRPLLEAGIRVFEWKGPMLHAKTAVADGRWARVGSSNLNVASWIGNYELDVLIEHEATAVQMEQMYLADLENSTEIVLFPRRRRRDSLGLPSARELRGISGGGRGSASRAAAGALRIGRAVGAALTEQRVLANTEARVLGLMGVVLLALGVCIAIWPLVGAVPLAVILVWMAVSLLIRARALRKARRTQGLPPTRVGRAGP